MSAYKDATGQWRFRKSIRLSDGRRERISGTPNVSSRQAAEKAEREAIDRLENPEKYPDMASKTTPAETFVTFVTEWLRTYPAATNKPSTVAHRELHVRMHLLPYWADTPLSDVTAQRLMRFVADMREKTSQRSTTGTRKRKDSSPQKKIAPQTVKNILSTLHKILMSAVAWKKLDKMPVFPKVKASKSEWDYLTKEESALLISAARTDEERALLTFALKTGARAGEQLALEWGDIDFANKIVTLQRSIFRGVVGDTKTGKARKIALAPSLAEALRKIKHIRGPLVFCDPDGKHLKNWHLKTLLWRCLRSAGLRKVRWHDLRHSFASQLVQMGVNLRQVQDWLGHSNLTTTLRYSHLAPTDAPRLIALLDSPSVAQ